MNSCAAATVWTICSAAATSASRTTSSRGSWRASMSASQLAQAELGKPHDFTVDEEMIRDPEAATFAKTPEEAADRWRQRVKFDLLKEVADDVAMDEAVKKLRKRYDSIRKSWQQTDNDELLERYLSAMTTGFDPHSSYMSPSTLDNFNITMRLELDGIGASLRSVDGYTVVQNIIPGGAADKHGGLKPEDKIVGVGEGADGPMEDIVDMKLNDVVKKIRGKRGTIVRLEVDPADNSERKTLDDHARPDRAQGQRSPQRDHRARQEGRRHAVSARRDPAAQLLHGHGRRPAGPAGLQEHDARRPPAARRVQDAERRRRRDRPALERRRLADRSRQHDRPVHRRRPGRAGEGPGRPHAAVQGPGAGHGLGRPAGGDDQQVQRQRERDLRRRDSGLRPRHRHRRPCHARQGHGAAAVRSGRSAVPHPRDAQHGRAEAHDSAVLSPGRRQHAESRRRLRCRAAVADDAPRRRRIRPRLRAGVRPRRSRCRTTCTTWSTPS